jgi:hypothetical protein
MIFPESMNEQEENDDGDIATYESMIHSSIPLPKYTLEDTFPTADIYKENFAILVYDPSADEFVGYYRRDHPWTPTCRKLVNSIQKLSSMLRAEFPERFQGEKSEELVIPISSGDYPQLKGSECIRGETALPCTDDVAPVLHFGSTFRRPFFPNMIAGPMPEATHLNCFAQWAREGTVCSKLVPREDGGEMNFGTEDGLEFDDLIPQLVWRGTDFSYLHTMYPTMHSPFFDKHADADVLRSQYSYLIPRWKGVVLTADSEAEARESGEMPLMNIKFAGFMHEGKLTPTLGSYEYERWNDVDIPAAGESMSKSDLAQYKYHIDIGGGGGTTWTGTIQKVSQWELTVDSQFRS